MKKICTLILISSVFSLCVSACNFQPDNSMVKTQRRFAKYIIPQKEKQGGVIDLSEGPKLNYDAYFGPQKLNFDFKIINPY